MKNNLQTQQYMIDFHTHILPQIDDGSASVEESMQMMALSYNYGVRVVALTPHFRASKESLEHFLMRRAMSYEKMRKAYAGDMKFLLGAEIEYYSGMDDASLCQLTLGKTNLALVEMPFSKWSDTVVNNIISINNSGHVRIVLAHIERFFPFFSDSQFDDLYSNGIMFQANSDSFNSLFVRHRLLSMTANGLIHFIGSDCHNMKSRKPDMEIAQTVIGKKLSDEAFNDLMKRSADIILAR